MHVQIFSVYDIKSKAFGQPFFSQTRGTAIRSFADLVNDKQTSVNKYPDDFTLFELGSFDDSSGEITPFKAPQSVGNAMEYILETKGN